MNIEQFRDYCLSKPGTTEDFPFDEVTLVFKVMEKMYSLTGLDNEIFKVNLKCDPEYAIELREQFEEISSGYHMSKKHWNTVNFEGNLSDKFLAELIDNSYNLVVKGLPKKVRMQLQNL